jgi:GNAT acetyltransferase-like protein
VIQATAVQLETKEQLAEQAHRLSSVVAIRVVRSFDEIESIRPIWSQWLSHRDSDIDFCVEFGWKRKDILRPHVIVLERDGRAQAMLVGWIENGHLRDRVGYLHFPAIPVRMLNFAYGGLLGDSSAENINEFVRAIVAALRNGEADLAALDHLRAGGPIFTEMLSSQRFLTRDHVVKTEPHSMTLLPGTVDELYRGFSQGLRAEIRRKKKKLLADFAEAIEISCYRKSSELDQVVPWLEEIASRTYQRALGVGFRDTHEMRQRLAFCADQGWLRIYVMRLKGEACAFWLGTLYNGSFISDYNSFDPKFREYSLGTYLLATVMEEFCKEGLRNVDFGFGQAEYKDRFGNCHHTEGTVCIFAPSAKGITLNAIRTSTGSLDKFARKALERTNLLPKIKRMWRNRVASGNPADRD